MTEKIISIFVQPLARPILGLALICGFTVQAQVDVERPFSDPLAPRDQALMQQASLSNVTSIVVVFKETAVTKKKGGKSSLEKAKFKRVKNQKKLFNTVKKSKKSKSGAKVLSKAGRNLKNAYKYDLADGVELNEAISELQLSPLVEYVQPDYEYHLLAMPNDTYVSTEQWSLKNTGQTFHDSRLDSISGTSGADIDWEPAYTAGLPTNKIIVAVVDTGVDYTHDDMKNQMWINPGEIADNGIDDDGNGYIDDIYGYDVVNADSDPMDDHLHGTHCAGTIAAEANNNYGMVGVNPNAKIMAVKIFKGDGSGAYSSITAPAIKYAADNGAQVMNNSWGGWSFDELNRDAVEYATELGCLFVAAAGNDNSGNVGHYPSSYPGAVSVAATTADDERAYFSNYGTGVDLSAPGHYIFSLLSSIVTPPYGEYDNDFLIISGTSMACPTAAGAASLLVAKYPGFTPWVYQKVMQATCESTNFYAINSNYVGKLGAGRIRVNEALNYTNEVAFLTSYVELVEGFGRTFLAPGESAGMYVKVATWLHDMTNLSIKVTALTADVSVSDPSTYSIGTLASQDVIILPDDAFTVTVAADAPWSENQKIRVELLQGTDVLATRTNTVPIYEGQLTLPTVYDLDGDGLKEVVGGMGSTVSAFDASGRLKWFFSLPFLYGPSGVSLGDVDGDGKGEVVFMSTLSAGANTFDRKIYVLEDDGTVKPGWPKDVWINRFNYTIGYSLDPRLADMDGDGDLDIVLNGLGNDYKVRYLVMDEEGATLGEYTSPIEKNAPSSLAVTDMDGDGDIEIVAFEQRLFLSTEPETVTLRILDHTAQPVHDWIVEEGPETRQANVYATSHFAPVLADLDADGLVDILTICYFEDLDGTKSHAKLCVWKQDGSFMPGFPTAADSVITVDMPVVADVDGDGDLEIFNFSASKHLLGWDHEGNLLPHFPIFEPSKPNQYAGGLNLTLANVDDDPDPELVYIGDYVRDGLTYEYTYNLYARDVRDGMLIRGYPIAYSGSDGFGFPPCRIVVEDLASSTFGTNTYIVSSVGSELNVYDTGYPFIEAAQQWPSRYHDAQRTSAHKPMPGNLSGGFAVDGSQTDVLAGSNAVFHSEARAASASAVYYRWDFDSDGIVDAEGYNLDAPTHTYASSGVYTVTLTLSNDVGEVYTRIREDYIQVHDTITADFSASTTNNADAPIRICFTDQSSSATRDWLWEYDLPGGETNWTTFSQGVAASNQNPTLDMMLAGTYTIRLTASCDFGLGGTSSDSATREITLDSVVANATNHYVWKGGRHLYPFKSWADAATNIQAACDAALNGEHVIVTNGIYTEQRIMVQSKALYIESVNGPEVTIVDSQYQYGGFYLAPYDWSTGEGTEGLPGSLVGFTVQHCLRPLYVSHGDILVDNMIIQDNVEDYESIVVMGSGARMINSLIQSNESFGTPLFVTEASMSNCVIRGNYCPRKLFVNMGNSQLDNCLFVDNETEGVLIQSALGSEISNCTIVGNRVFSYESVPRVMVLYSGSYSLLFDNNIMYGNLELDLDGNVLGPATEWDSDISPTRLKVRNSCYREDPLGLPASYKTNALVGVDPLFVDAANGDYRLQTNSPCVDSGYNFTLYRGDLLRTYRIDFGPAATLTTGNWNNVTNGTVGTKVDNMVDDTGLSSSADLVFTEPFGLTGDDGAVDSTLYPSTAQRDTLYTISHTNWYYDYFQFENLNPSNRYELTFFASSTNSRTVYVEYKLRDAIYDRDPLLLDGNTSNTVMITEISAPDGTIVIGVQSGRIDPGYGVLGVVELREYTTDPRSPLANRVDLDGRARLVNGTVDMGVYELHENDLPLISIRADATEGPTPFTVAFTAEVSDVDGAIANIQWNFGDGSASNGAALTSVSHTYITPGSYYAEAIVTDNDGGSFFDGLMIMAGDPLPVAPTNFTAVNLSPTNNALSWDDLSSDETAFEVRRRLYTDYWECIVDDSEGVPCGEEDFIYYYKTATNATAYGGTYLWVDAVALKGANPHLIFDPGIPEACQYEVFEWHPVMSRKVTKVSMHTLNTPGGVFHMFVDQNINGGQWNSLGVYDMEPGSFLQNRCWAPERDVLVDAYKFVRVPDFETIAVLPTDTTNYLHNGLQDDTAFEYQLAATNAYGYSDWVTAWATIPTTNLLPGATILSATPTNGEASLLVSVIGEGIDADGTVTNYLWNFGDNYSGSVQSGANMTNAQYVYDFDGTYTISLTVWDDRGFSNTNTAEVTVTVQGTAPTAPTNLYVMPNGQSIIDLNWTDTSYNEDLFIIQRKQGAEAFANLATVNTPSSLYSDNTVTPGDSYTYRVAASNIYGISGWSGEATTNTPDVTPPVILSGVAPTATNVLVIFNEALDHASAGIAGYYTLNNGGTVLSVTHDTGTPDRVTLTTSALAEGLQYTLSVTGVEDLYGSAASDEQVTIGYYTYFRALIDFGYSTMATTEGNWNNVFNNALGVQLADIVNTNGDASGISLEITDVYHDINGTGETATDLYPPTAGRDNFTVSAGVLDDPLGVFDLTNLDPTKPYSLTFFGSRKSSDRAATYTVGTQSVVLDNSYNTANTVSIEDIFPDENGTITVSLTLGNETDFGYMGVVELYYPAPVAAAALETSVSSLNVPEGSTNSFGVRLTAAPFVETTVSVDFVSGDSDLSVQSGSNLVFTTSDWMSFKSVTLVAAPDDDWFNSNALFLCSSPGMADLYVTATEDDDELNPAYALPWSEPFEALSQGTLDGQHGWTSSGAMVTNSDAQSGSQSLSVSEGAASHTFDGAPTNIWIEFWSQPVRGVEPGAITGSVSAVFYVNTNDQIVAYSNTTAIVLGTIVSNGWNKFGIQCDYVSKVWKLSLNEVPMVENFAFYGNPASFAEVEFQSTASTEAFIDSINVTDSLGDADTLPDWWEQYYFGDLSPNPDDPAANPDYTVWQCYVAGLDPTDPDALFELSNARNILGWNAVSGRVYTIYWTSNLLSSFQTLETNVSWNPAIFTDTTHTAEEKGFYKIDVELE